MKRVIVLIVAIVFLVSPLAASAKEGIVNTRHNLSFTGPGEIKALPGADPLNRICVFCHTPHNAAPRTPLWNKAIEPVSYVLYTSTTMGATPSQPTGPSRLCLSCHDGTLALGAVLRPAGGIATTGQIASGRPSYLGAVLSGDHPFSFSYFDSISNPLAGLSPTLPPGFLFYNNGFIHCSTCHDAHEDAYKSADINGYLTGKFLVAENRRSALCMNCHSAMEGWGGATHRTTAGLRPLTGVLPVSPKKWPTWNTVAEWGCESCHTSHSAAGQQRLLNFTEEENNCYLCHDGTVAVKNIKGQFQKMSAHRVEATTGVHDPKELPALITTRHAECGDCHNPHAANGIPALPPLISGRLEKVSGVDANKSGVYPAINEYEICFKCHADLAPQVSFIPRVIESTNTRLEFSLSNPSYHPVIGIGKNPNVPSIPSTSEPALTATSIIYCTACHSDDAGVSRGPHGSSYPPILREQYETADGTIESPAAYALCYRCHNRASILNDDSFKKTILSGKGGHSGHLAAGAPCSSCHDPHGIVDDSLSGSHTKLMNFDSRIVLPVSSVPPNNKPRFTDAGTSSGSCTLVCHGVTHNNLSYP
jgi:predicted CXXCH cytochrome family protein